MFHIGFTGTQKGMSINQFDDMVEIFKDAIAKHKDVVLHHGDCLGADHQAHDLAVALGIRTHIHPPNDEKMRAFCKGDSTEPEKKDMDRNQDIVNASDLVIATPAQSTEVLRSGTWATVRRARKKGVELIILDPQGTK